MSLFDPAIVATPAQEAAQRCFGNAKTMHQNCIDLTTITFNDIWNNPNASPADVLAAIGLKGAEFFDLSGKLQGLLNEAEPGCINLAPPVPVTINPDGTVTITPATVAPPSDPTPAP